MQEVKVETGEAGQRFDKYLKRKLSGAPSSFLYKMLRKKNITLNGKKATGQELISSGDVVAFFLSDETYEKFGGRILGKAEGVAAASDLSKAKEYLDAYQELSVRIPDSHILYEDEDVLFLHKPAGVLSQKAEATDVSANEWLIGYLLTKGKLNAEDLSSFKPSISNRLDRNTGGILMCAVSLQGARELATLLRDRNLHKYYMAVVCGQLDDKGVIEGYLVKDEKTNRVSIMKEAPMGNSSKDKEGNTRASYTKTTYRTIKKTKEYSLIECELITGKTHQIRAHLASIGHAIVGDVKYGKADFNSAARKKYGVRNQMLWCYKVVFPKMREGLVNLSLKEIQCPPPEVFERIMRE